MTAVLVWLQLACSVIGTGQTPGELCAGEVRQYCSYSESEVGTEPFVMIVKFGVEYFMLKFQRATFWMWRSMAAMNFSTMKDVYVLL